MKYEKIVWLDLETGGVDPHSCQITQVGALATGPAPDFEVIGMFEAKVQLIQGKYTKEALDAQNYDEKVWERDAKPSDDVHVAFCNWVKEFSHNRVSARGKLFAAAHLAGHNVKFDGDFIRHNWGYTPVTNWTGGYYDTMDVQKTIDVISTVAQPNYKLETLCEFYGVDPGGHDALADIDATVKVARAQLIELARVVGEYL